jgi:molybdenum-dependent DNA-binding transcriptional regulator ModE
MNSTQELVCMRFGSRLTANLTIEGMIIMAKFEITQEELEKIKQVNEAYHTAGIQAAKQKIKELNLNFEDSPEMQSLGDSLACNGCIACPTSAAPIGLLWSH